MKVQHLFLGTTVSALLLFSLPSCNTRTGVDSNTKTIAAEVMEIDEDKDKDLTGIFSADGKNYTGRVSVQNFEATGQYSVLCQDDTDPNASTLIQFVFKDEVSARAAGPRTIAYDQGKEQTPAEVSVSYEISFASHEARPGTFTVVKNGNESELLFDGVEVEDVNKEKKTVSGKIPF